MRRTKVFATLGPKSYATEIMGGMIEAGVNKFRLNLSHVNQKVGYPFLAAKVQEARNLARSLGKSVEIMVDTPGHKFRLGEFVERIVKVGEVVELTLSEEPKNGELPFPHPHYLNSMMAGQEVIIGDGQPRLRVVRQAGPNVLCKVSLGGELKSGRGVTCRGVRIGEFGLPALTTADVEGLQFAVDNEAEEVVMSYGTSYFPMQRFNKFYREIGGKGRTLFKYELGEAAGDLQNIVRVSDGGFVGQGDLGLSIPHKRVPTEAGRVNDAFMAVQKKCYVCTQLLPSMCEDPFAKHGETAGIYYYVFRRFAALGVSNETSTGKYPVRVIEELVAAIEEAEVLYP